MPKIKLVSFDVWDTLLSINSFYRSLAAELAKITCLDASFLKHKLIEGYVKVRAVRRAGGFEDSEIVPMCLKTIANFIGIPPKTIAEAVVNATENFPAEKHRIEGVEETLSCVKRFGFEVIVVGNVVFWPGKQNRILLEKAGLSRYIDRQFYADELIASKPKPEIFVKALSEFNVQPQEALHVGDSLFEDFAGAVVSRMNAALIDRNVEHAIKLSGWNAYIIPEIRALPAILKELVER